MVVRAKVVESKINGLQKSLRKECTSILNVVYYVFANCITYSTLTPLLAAVKYSLLTTITLSVTLYDQHSISVLYIHCGSINRKGSYHPHNPELHHKSHNSQSHHLSHAQHTHPFTCSLTHDLLQLIKLNENNTTSIHHVHNTHTVEILPGGKYLCMFFKVHACSS